MVILDDGTVFETPNFDGVEYKIDWEKHERCAFWESMGSGLVGAIGSMFGQQSANDANKEIANNANAQSQANAREQMAFQERMSNTSHAREVQDLKNAGLNPILSANAGAASPGGAAGNVQTANMENVMGGLSAAARDMVGFNLQKKKQEKEIELMGEQKELVKSQKTKTDVDATVASKGIPEAEIKNRAFDLMRPLLDKIENWGKSNSKPRKYNIEPGNIENPWRKH